MSKKIVSLLLVLLVAFSCTMTVFCTEKAANAPAEAQVPVDGEIAEAPAMEMPTSIIPEDQLQGIRAMLTEDTTGSVTVSPSFDEKENKLTLTVKNNGTVAIADAQLALNYTLGTISIGNDNPIVTIEDIEVGGEKQIIFPVELKGDKPAVEMILLFSEAAGSDVIDMTEGTNNTPKYVYTADIFNAGGNAGEKISFLDAIKGFLGDMGFAMIANNWKVLIMILISFVLMYLAIVKKFEPLLLLPIAFGMLLTNLPGAGMYHTELFSGGHVHWDMFAGKGNITPGLIDYLYLGVKLGIYPCLIFVGVGAMTDFGPLIANPKSLLLGAAAQVGIFLVFFGTRMIGFTPFEAASTGIIGGADGPTAIFVTSKLAPDLLGPIAVAAYSYMALVPVIQPPIMKLLTTKKERQIVMKQLRPVSKTEKIIFPIVVTTFVALLLPSAAPLIGCLMLGNLLTECGVTERLSKTVQNELMNIVTIFLGISVGATATADVFLTPKTLAIIAMGIVAFGCGTAGGVLLAKFMNLFTKNKINPLIGSAGVSAVPMAARVSQTVGQKENPKNFLLMHAMGPNVAGVIGSAIAAGAFLTLFMK